MPGKTENLDILRRLVGRKVLHAALTAVPDGLAILEDGVRLRCPVGVTHQLSDSIHTTPPRATRTGVTGGVVVGTDHALPVEYGTHDRPAEPFVRPTSDIDGPRAVRATRATFLREVSR